MKKQISMLLALCLLAACGAQPPAVPQGAVHNPYLAQDDTIASVEEVEPNRFLAMHINAVTAVMAEMPNASLLEKIGSFHIARYGDAVYTYDNQSNLYRIADDGSMRMLYQAAAGPAHLVGADDTFVYLQASTSTSMADQARLQGKLLRVNTATGEAAEVCALPPQQLTEWVGTMGDCMLFAARVYGEEELSALQTDAEVSALLQPSNAEYDPNPRPLQLVAASAFGDVRTLLTLENAHVLRTQPVGEDACMVSYFDIKTETLHVGKLSYDGSYQPLWQEKSSVFYQLGPIIGGKLLLHYENAMGAATLWLSVATCETQDATPFQASYFERGAAQTKNHVVLVMSEGTRYYQTPYYSKYYKFLGQDLPEPPEVEEGAELVSVPYRQYGVVSKQDFAAGTETAVPVTQIWS